MVDIASSLQSLETLPTNEVERSLSRRDALACVFSTLTIPGLFSSVLAEEKPAAATLLSPPNLKTYQLPLNKEVAPYPPAWGPVAEEIAKYYPPFAHADKVHLNASTLIKAQKELMEKLKVRHPSNGPHELCHGMQHQLFVLFGNRAEIRNLRSIPEGGIVYEHNQVQAIYLENGVFAFCHDPWGISQREVINALPEFSRSWHRFELYVKMGLDPSSRHTVGYLLDELAAYCVGARCALTAHSEVVKLNQTPPVSRLISEPGHAELALFALTLAMVADSKNDAFRSSNDKAQFMAVVSALTSRAILIERELCNPDRFPAYNFVDRPRTPVAQLVANDPGASRLRTWMNEKFGDAWYREVFGGPSIWSELNMTMSFDSAEKVAVIER